jgi:hypothetical protein
LADLRKFPRKQLNLQNLIERRLTKPGEILIRKEILMVLNEDPQTELAYIGHFNLRNYGARR